MSINKYNTEGYYAPVTYEALMKIEKEERAARKVAAFRPMVYICSPYSGNIEKNTANARMYSRFAVAKKNIPFAPHLLLPQYISEGHERGLAMFMNKVFLGKCDELWVFGSEVSAGMSEEIEQAGKMRKKIRYFTAELQEVSQ
ncbi:DUF4406 domain-containing protein [Clostridium kluyveri]|uniref:DUF4406 domain-containing protein n=1 Tax=Clostridium kluyveri TaxID=1534 RepID=A0A1L5FAV6_CLOKL|nr:DUF4406 domain-containing protein [Clostridium kluyveri]APM39950.1 DUF4406 domain-containing protein [Clostridium kluyveri]